MSTNPEAESDSGDAWTGGEAPDGNGERSVVNRIDLDVREASIPTPDPNTCDSPKPAEDD